MSKILPFLPKSFQEIFENLPKKVKNDQRLHPGHIVLYSFVTQNSEKGLSSQEVFERIGKSFGVSRTTVGKFLKNLECFGYLTKIIKNNRLAWQPKKEEEETHLKHKNHLSKKEVIQEIEKKIKDLCFISETNLNKILKPYNLIKARTFMNMGLASYKFGRKRMINTREFLEKLSCALNVTTYLKEHK